MLTKVLDVLISGESEDTLLWLRGGTAASTECLVDDNSVRDGCGNERSTISELGHLRVVVEGQV